MDSERFMADQRRACKATSRRPGEAASISRWELASVRASIITRFAWWLAHFSAHTSDFVIGVVTHLTNCLLMGLGDWVWAPPMPLPSQPAGTAQNCERELCVLTSQPSCVCMQDIGRFIAALEQFITPVVWVAAQIYPNTPSKRSYNHCAFQLNEFLQQATQRLPHATVLPVAAMQLGAPHLALITLCMRMCGPCEL